MSEENNESKETEGDKEARRAAGKEKMKTLTEMMKQLDPEAGAKLDKLMQDRETEAAIRKDLEAIGAKYNLETVLFLAEGKPEAIEGVERPYCSKHVVIKGDKRSMAFLLSATLHEIHND